MAVQIGFRAAPMAACRPHLPRLAVRAAAAEGDIAAAAAAAPAASRFAITLRKPLGLVLAERKPSGEVFVEEVVAGGNAAKTGAIQAGDVLRRCSATSLKGDKGSSGSEVGHGEYLYNNWERIMVDTKGLDFKTVMAAIASNNERWGIFDVELELERPAA